MNENELTGLLESLRRMGSDDLNVEVKESATALSRDVWETVSAFANTAGGIIVLGVSERTGFVPVANFETEKVLNQFVAGMGDAGGRGAHKHLAFRIMFHYESGEADLYLLPPLRGGEGQPVVTVDRALDAAGPGERFLRAEEYGSYREELLCDDSLHIICSEIP